MYYILINTPAYKVKHRLHTRDQVRKDLAEEWKTLNEEEKNVYMEMGRSDQLRYQREMLCVEQG